MKQLRRHPEGVDLGPLRPTMPERLQTKDQRIDLAPDLVVGDLPRLQAWLDERRSDAGGRTTCVLIGRRHKQDNNSWMHNIERLTRGRPRHQLLMHPDDLAERGIADGDLVTVTSRVGAVTVEVAGDRRHDARRGLPPPRLRTPGRRHPAAHGPARCAGVSINDLTDPDLLDVSGNAALSGVPVTVAPA